MIPRRCTIKHISNPNQRIISPIVMVAQKNENAIHTEKIILDLVTWSWVTHGLEESLSNSWSALTVSMVVTEVTMIKKIITAAIMARFRLLNGRVLSICHVKLCSACKENKKYVLSWLTYACIPVQLEVLWALISTQWYLRPCVIISTYRLLKHWL